MLIGFAIACFVYNVFIEGLFSKEHRPPNHYGIVIFTAKGSTKDCRILFKQIALGFKTLIHLAYGVALFVLIGFCCKARNFASRVVEYNCVDSTSNEIFTTINNAMDWGLMWTVFSFWFVYILVEPNLTWILRIKCFGRDLQYNSVDKQNTSNESEDNDKEIYVPPSTF